MLLEESSRKQVSLNSSKSSASFCNIFLQQNFPITFPSPPLLPAELKSIILVLPWARVRYLCGMVGKRKRGDESGGGESEEVECGKVGERDGGVRKEEGVWMVRGRVK